MRLRQRSAMGLASAAIVAVGVLVVPVGSAQGNEGVPEVSDLASWLPDVAFSDKLPSDVIAEGTVYLPDSSRPAAGAQVYLKAWPGEEIFAAMEVGDPLELIPIAKTLTDKSGRFSLRVDPSVDLARSTSRAGVVDVSLVVVHDDEWVSYGFSIVPDEMAMDDDPYVAAVGSAGKLSDVAQPMVVDLELGYPDRAKVGAEDLAVDEGNGVSAQHATESSGVGYMSWRSGACPGGDGLKHNYGGRWVYVGSVHITTSGKQMRFSYTGSASSTLGIGVSASGAYGSFSASGTKSQSRAQSVGWGWWTTTTNRHLDTQFRYGRHCVSEYAGGWMHRYEVRSNAHLLAADTRTTSAPSVTASNCRTFGATSNGSKVQSDAITWSTGAKLGGAIGIDLSSRTGFRSNAKSEWKFVTRSRLCGTHAPPENSPRRLVMTTP